MKRKLRPFAIFAIILAVVTVFAHIASYVIHEISLSPYEYLCENAQGDAETQIPMELLHEEAHGEDEWIVFFRNQKGRISCAMLKESFLSYNVLGYAAEIPLDYTKPYLYAGFRNGEDVDNLVWGLLDDLEVNGVTIDGYPCSIAEVPQYGIRIYWIWDNHWGENPSKMPEYEEIR